MRNVNVSKVRKLLESYCDEIDGWYSFYNDKVKDGRSLKIEIYSSGKISWEERKDFWESKIKEVEDFCKVNNIKYRDIEVCNNINMSLRLVSWFRIKVLN